MINFSVFIAKIVSIGRLNLDKKENFNTHGTHVCVKGVSSEIITEIVHYKTL
jgi:hypothetical protein